LSPYFNHLIEALLTTADKPGQDSNFRASAYEAVSSLVSNCARDCLPTVQLLAGNILEKLEKNIAVQNQFVGQDDKRAHLELQANLCSVLTVNRSLD
jgi:importin subunit beta-1